MSHLNFTTIRQYYPPSGIYLPANSIIGSVPTHLRQEAWNAQSLPPVPLSDTCGRLCIYIWMKTLRQSRYPPPKSLRLRSLWLVFVVCFIVFIPKMSQGQVNDIMTDAQFLGFKNDRGVIPLCYDFPCKFIKIKWKMRRCGKKKLSFVFIFCSQAFVEERFMRSKRTCFCFSKTVIL